MRRHIMSYRGYLVLALAAAILSTGGSLPAAERYEWKDGQWVELTAAAEGTAAGELALVRDYHEAGRYGTVVEAAKKFIKRYPDDAGYEEVCLLAGQAEMERRRYYQAFEWFEKQLSQFPAGRYSERALLHEYEVAEAFLGGAKRIVFGGLVRLNATDEALQILLRVAEHAPGTDLAAKSLMRAGDWHFEHREWAEATQAYDSLLKLMPNSPRAVQAMHGACEATYQSYGGPAFDETPLLDAQQRFKTFQETYPAEAMRAGVSETLDQITEKLAGKVLVTAQFYERVHKDSAAVYYYTQLLAQYPSGPCTTEAHEALVRLGGEVVPPAAPAPLPAPVESAAAPTKGDLNE